MFLHPKEKQRGNKANSWSPEGCSALYWPGGVPAHVEELGGFKWNIMVSYVEKSLKKNS